LFRVSNHHTWTQGTGIHFAPLSQLNAAQAKPPNANVCVHFAQGHCKFGAKCKRSHALTAQAAHIGSVSTRVKQLDLQLRKLFEGFACLNGMSYSDMKCGSRIDQFVEFINDNVKSIKQTLTFTPSKDVSQSLFSHERVQNIAKHLNLWWKSIAAAVIKPHNLYNAIQSLDSLIRDTNQNMALTADFVRRGDFSNVNYFQNGSTQSNLRSRVFNSNVSNSVQGKYKKKGNGRAAYYLGGNNKNNGVWNDIFRGNDYQSNVGHNNHFDPNVAKNNDIYKNNSDNLNGKARRGHNGSMNGISNIKNGDNRNNNHGQVSNRKRPQRGPREVVAEEWEGEIIRKSLILA
jgi:hypothetical protein